MELRPLITSFTHEKGWPMGNMLVACGNTPKVVGTKLPAALFVRLKVGSTKKNFFESLRSVKHLQQVYLQQKIISKKEM